MNGFCVDHAGCGRSSRSLRLRAAVLVALVAALFADVADVDAQVSVTVSSATRYQTIRGWGSTTPWQSDVPERLRRQMIAVGVEDLRLNCFRFEPPAGWFNQSTGGPNHRWEWNNDDDDPLHINWAAMNTAGLDAKVARWLLPIKQAVEAGGRPFDLQISPSFFDGGSSGSAPVWLLNSPGEYAEYAASLLLRLRDVHGIEADYYTICNEAGNNNSFSPGVVGRMIKALGPRMERLGLSTRIEFPESINAYAAWSSITQTQNDARVWKYIDVISYHLYGGRDYRDDLRDFAIARGLTTAQTEFMDGSGNAVDFLYGDLIDGGVSEWEVYGQGFPAADNTRTSFSRSSNFWTFRQIMPYVEPGAVRIGAVSNNATLRPLAFDNGGEVTVVLLNTSSTSANQTVTVAGLPAGSYGVSQSVYKGRLQELGLRTVGGDGLLTLSVVKGAMLTIYPHNSGNLPPELVDWKAANSYLKLGVSDSTVLSAAAVDPELDTLSYTWTVADQPTGASAILATPNAAQTAADGLSVAGQYAFAVEVSDGTETTTREVLLNVYDGNQLPTIDLHMRIPVQLILPASSTTLRVYAWDPENDPLAYQWSLVSGPTGASVTFAAPTSTSCNVSGLTVAGDYVFRATVNDGTDTTHHDMLVTVEPEDLHSPIITNASGSVYPNGCALLSASTNDVDGDEISHWWEWVSGPADANVAFRHQGRATTPVWTDTAGTYRFRLCAVGRTKASFSSLITMVLPAAAPPIPGDADLDGDVDLNDFVTLKLGWSNGDGWDQGDFNSDGDVDLQDFVLLKQNWGTTGP